MNDESAFLQALREEPADEVSRLVYADWLEERGDPRGDFLRLEVHLSRLPDDDPRRAEWAGRLDALRESLDSGWLALLDRTPVENCGLPFRFRCPRRWEELQSTPEDRVRFCHECQREVFHCGSIDEARERARQGLCVAVDSRLAWAEGDLDEGEDEEIGMTVGLLLSDEEWPRPNNEPGPGGPPDERPAPRPWWRFW